MALTGTKLNLKKLLNIKIRKFIFKINLLQNKKTNKSKYHKINLDILLRLYSPVFYQIIKSLKTSYIRL